MEYKTKTIANIKGLLFSVLILFTIACSNSDNNTNTKVSVSLSMNSTDYNGYIYLERMTPDQIILVDSIYINTGKSAKFEMPSAQIPDIFLLRFNNGQAITLITDNTQEIDIIINSYPFNENYIVKGSPSSLAMQNINTLINFHIGTFDSLYSNYRQASTDSIRSSIRAQTDTLLRQNQLVLYNSLKDSVRSHANSLVALMGLYSKFGDSRILDNTLDFSLFKLVADSLLARFPTNTHAISFMQKTISLENNLENIEKKDKLLDKGNIFPDLKLISVDESTISLHTFNSKYYIIYLWKASKAGFREKNEALDLIRTQHGNNIHIIGISFENDKLRWSNICTIEKMKWTNLLANEETELHINPKGNYPMFFLLNNEFKIIERSNNLDTILKSYNTI
jgi:hypothetical protein